MKRAEEWIQRLPVLNKKRKKKNWCRVTAEDSNEAKKVNGSTNTNFSTTISKRACVWRLVHASVRAKPRMLTAGRCRNKHALQRAIERKCKMEDGRKCPKNTAVKERWQRGKNKTEVNIRKDHDSIRGMTVFVCLRAHNHKFIMMLVGTMLPWLLSWGYTAITSKYFGLFSVLKQTAWMDLWRRANRQRIQVLEDDAGADRQIFVVSFNAVSFLPR